jgi:hypothetical protein
MPTKKIESSQQIYQIKVTLLGTSPPIWRRLLVPADLTLAQLHDVLQAAMGWEDGHMHEFSVGQRRFGRPDPEDRLMGMPSAENERTVRLASTLGRVGSKAIYTYDFGDTWEHSIVLEKRLPVDPNARARYHISNLHGRPTRVSTGRLWRRSRTTPRHPTSSAIETRSTATPFGNV